MTKDPGLLISPQFALAPMVVFSIRVEDSLDLSIAHSTPNAQSLHFKIRCEECARPPFHLWLTLPNAKPTFPNRNAQD
jgi:hypothetical protein